MKTFYGIRNKKTLEPLWVDISSNDGMAFCNSYSAHFSKISGSHIYLVSDRKDAEAALTEDIKWYNSSSTKPCFNGNDKSDFEIFKVDLPVK